MPKTKQQCEEIRENTKSKIMNGSLIYFAKNGFAGTKMSDLSNYIGVGQGTIYCYFKSKEDLFNEIVLTFLGANKKNMLRLMQADRSIAEKILRLSAFLIQTIEAGNTDTYNLVLCVRIMIEGNNTNLVQYYEKVQQLFAQMILAGQKEGTIIEGNAEELSDYYWSIVQMLSIKKVFDNNFTMIRPELLARILIK
jgi:AcrR family transcriptional regulator